MTSESNIHLDPAANVHRVAGASHSTDQAGKNKYQKPKSPAKDSETIDEQLEKSLDVDESENLGTGEFHVIDYKA